MRTLWRSLQLFNSPKAVAIAHPAVAVKLLLRITKNGIDFFDLNFGVSEMQISILFHPIPLCKQFS